MERGRGDAENADCADAAGRLCAAAPDGDALVEGPVLLMPPQEGQIFPAAQPLLARAEGLPAEAAEAALVWEGPEHRSACLDAPEHSPILVQPLTDRNGYPMTGCTHVRTVYTACPLQDMPG